MAFSPVSPQIDFPQMEKELLEWWYSSGIVEKYLRKNSSASKKFSFLDGPITANNPMGVHHAWGRTYKDLFQRYHNLKGEAGRFQNGFDCQGLWVEVEVEKELGFKSKKDIETYGIGNFVNKCKERVHKYSALQTQQSQRLGYFMDWDNSYFTMSDDNNYAIWSFLKTCWSRGWIYKGNDVVPWCPRCETAISQHEILTEDYKQVSHESIFLALPIRESPGQSLLIWTTTPWTLPANTVVSVSPDQDYSLVEDSGGLYWVAKAAVSRLFSDPKIVTTQKGAQLVGLHYTSPFDHLPAIKETISNFPDKFHVVVATDDQIMPISTEEGTGLVHTSTSTGEEDHRLGKKLGLPVIPAIDDSAFYLDGFGQFAGQNAKKHPELIIDYLKNLTSFKYLYKTMPYSHRYPACWRCKAELVWKVTDEWYISMDLPDPTDSKKRTFRQQMIHTAKSIHWLPEFGLDRELDWLKNMHDWLISKKNRYWGLALPIYECPSCGHFEVIGSRDELQSRAVSGWEKFSGNSPHRPWIDEVKIKCQKCSSTVSRVSDVGNPWLDAGIVSISTLPTDWFPADFITESFPGQFKNWFYSLIAMSTVLKKSPPFKTVLGYASLLAEDGRPMHKSWGNSIEFNEGADKIGADVMRWVYASQNPESNLLFGYRIADEVRRRFHLIIWNVYNFFITYANLDNFTPGKSLISPKSLTLLDKWLLSRLDQTTKMVSQSLDKFDAASASHALEEFVSDLSQWYVRRVRDRVGPAVSDSPDKIVTHTVLYRALTGLMKLLAPINPFISESIYKNLTGEESVHLTSWPKVKSLTKSQTMLIAEMKVVRKIVEAGLSQRKEAQIKVRQPLSSIKVVVPGKLLPEQLLQLVRDELNVKQVDISTGDNLLVELDKTITQELQEEGQVRELIRKVQQTRKELSAKLDQHIVLDAPVPEKYHELIKKETLADEIHFSSEFSVRLVN